MPQVRTITAWYTETVEIKWSRPSDIHDPSSPVEVLTERHTAPPTSTWEAKRETITPEGSDR